jgi:aldose 1-epimerase
MHAPQQPAFRHEAASDPESGWRVHTLSGGDATSRRSAAARIVPEAGSNLVSLVVDGEELLHVPPSIRQAPGVRFGAPILYPTPNRVRDARFTFDGRLFTFEPNDRSRFIHGLVHSAPWRAEPPVVTAEAAALRTVLDFDEAFPGFARFPIRHRIAVTFTLRADGLSIGFAVENHDRQRLPFGFALHPFFRIPGSRALTFVRVPAARHMEAEDLLPTGRLEPLDGSRFDLRGHTALDALDLDDVYCGLTPGDPAGYESRDRRLRVTLEATEVFTHAVVYTPPGRPFFCLESQTCSTDAHNLHARGLEAESHLIVLEPGAAASGSVRMRVSRL